MDNKFKNVIYTECTWVRWIAIDACRLNLIYNW